MKTKVNLILMLIKIKSLPVKIRMSIIMKIKIIILMKLIILK